MVHIVKSTRDACAIRQKVLIASDKHMVLLHKRLGNIVFLVNKMVENLFKVLGHQMGEPASQTTSHAGLFGHLMFPSSA